MRRKGFSRREVLAGLGAATAADQVIGGMLGQEPDKYFDVESFRHVVLDAVFPPGFSAHWVRW